MAEAFLTRFASATLSALGDPMATRIEPSSISGDPQTGLAAQVWDPLWFLARQWQFGEFAGDDAGTPLAVTVGATFDPVTAWRPDDARPWQPLVDRSDLLHRQIEAERGPVVSDLAGGGLGQRTRAAAAWALADALASEHPQALSALVRNCPSRQFSTPARQVVGAASLVDPWTTWATFLDGRLPDPEAVVDAFRGPRPPDWWHREVAEAEREGAQEVMDAWLSWFRAELERSGTPQEAAWVPDRLEYDAWLSTRRDVLHVRGHAGGPIEWSTVDLAPSAEPYDADAGHSRQLVRTVLASPLSFPGMPSTRFWEMENATLDLGAVWADPHQLARLLVVECALVYGGDWLVVPLDSPRNGVLAVDRVWYRDTFGTTWVVEGARPSAPPGEFKAPWRMYAVTETAWEKGVERPVQSELRGLYVPPAMPAAHEGPPIEDVTFLRDETANLVWAVERTVPGPSGDPLAPQPTPAPPLPNPDPGLSGNAAEVLGYQLMSHVPETWTPYLARIATGPADTRFGVDLVQGSARVGAATTSPTGVLLGSGPDGGEHAVICSAEVPRDGIRIQRVPVVARRGDGSWTSWIARRVLAGRGEAASGLAFDRTYPPARPDP